MLETEFDQCFKERGATEILATFIGTPFFSVDVLIPLTGDICSIDVTDALRPVLRPPLCCFDQTVSPSNAPLSAASLSP